MSLATSQTQTTAPRPRWIRRVAVGVSALVGLSVVAAVTVPMFVDVNKYRPMLLEKANQKINGKLDIGKLSLSLWGRVHVGIDGLRLLDAAGKSVIEVQDASFNLPFWTILIGRPELRLEMHAPNIHIVKERDGKLNVMEIVKSAPAAAGAATSTSTSTATNNGTATAIPAIALNARLTLLLSKADLTYKDETTGDSYKVNDLNFTLKDVSPSSQMPFEISAVLDVVMKNGTKVSGPLVLTGLVKGESSGGSFEKARFSATLKLDDATIVSPGTFEKKSGTALNLALDGTASASGVNVSSFQLRLASISLNGSAAVETKGETTSVDVKAKSNNIALSSLGDVSPMAREYNLSGTLSLDAHASGPTSRMAYGADLKLSKMILNSSAMKQPLTLDGSLVVATNELKSLSAKLSAKNFDLALTGMLQDFTAPKFRFSLKSNDMDLDGLLKATAAAADRRAEAAKSTGTTESRSAAPGAAPVVDYDAMFKPLRENPTAAAANGALDFDLKKVKATGIVMENIKGEVLLDRLLVQLKNFSMKIFDGTIGGQASFNAKTAKPEVGTNLTVNGLQTKKMMESQMPFAKNTIQGVLSAKLNIGGAGLNPNEVISSWKGSGTLDIKDAVFSTLDFGKQIKDGVLSKLPPVIGSKIHADNLANWKSQYDNVDVKYSLANGVFNLNDINGKAHPNQGMDLKGSGKTVLSNYALDMNLDLIDTYNITGAENTVKDERYGKFALALKLDGTLFSPRFDWGATVSRLAQSALKQQLKQQSGSLLKNLPAGLGGNAKSLMKGLFGH